MGYDRSRTTYDRSRTTYARTMENFVEIGNRKRMKLNDSTTKYLKN